MHPRHPRIRTLAVALLTLLLASVATAGAPAEATPGVATLSRATLAKGSDGFPQKDTWLFHSGDESTWAMPAYDDDLWELVPDATLLNAARPSDGWKGIGWFRLNFVVAEDVVGEPLGVQIVQAGASEVYLDGKLLKSYGKVSADPADDRPYNPRGEVVPVVFDRAGHHLIAIRYSCPAIADSGATILGAWARRLGAMPGLTLSIETATNAIANRESGRTIQASINFLFIGMLQAFALLHLFLYVFYRKQKGNLYYAYFAFGFCAMIFASQIRSVTNFGVESFPIFQAINRFGFCMVFLGFIAFLYSAFSMPFTWIYRSIFALWSVALLIVLLINPRNDWFVTAAIFFSVSESVRAQVVGLRNKVDGAWIIGAGVQSFALALTLRLISESLRLDSWLLEASSLIALYGLPICVSVFLARSVGKTNERLEAKLNEVENLSRRTLEQERRAAELALQREQERARGQEAELRAAAAELQVRAAEAQAQALEAEHHRKTQELEEARQLQLSMLPKNLPQLPHLRVAAYMRTATEVGGDYYDYHLSDDGTLTIAVGDATGHGLKAGTLVAATKSLFRAMACNPDIRATFGQMTRALKEMKLGRLFMALSIAKFTARRMTICAAGMPAALVYRAATGTVETVLLKGMPLGAFRSFPYDQRDVDLDAGDTILLLSDGFPEMFNDERDMLGYDRTAEIFQEIASRDCNDIIAELRTRAEAWANGRPPDDDVTFVVVKMLDGAAAG